MKKFDKKKNKQLCFALRQAAMDTLRAEEGDPVKAFRLSVQILFNQMTGLFIELPETAVGYRAVLCWLDRSGGLSEGDHRSLLELLDVLENRNLDPVPADGNQHSDLVSRVKGFVLVKKGS